MATSLSTGTPQETPLRKRMGVLERAHSLSSLNTLGPADVLPDMKFKHKDSGDEIPSSPQTEYESHSESSDEEHSTGEEDRSYEPPKPRRPTVNTSQVHNHERSPMSPKSRAWYEFDLAVVVALVSPIGNWLTGGDHIKNLLLIFLLIFYLHQIIEIPWALYQKSRPRTRVSNIPAYAEPDSPEARYSQLAASELQKFEFLFLFLTFVSPLLGAVLLRYATGAVLGPDAVSWFSTGLFVLATGMRPWAHLVDRLSQRTTDLHDFVHYPSSTQGIAVEEHKALTQRVEQLEKALSKIRIKVETTTDDVYEYVDDAVDAVEHAMRKQERKWDRYEGKVKEVEQVVVQLSNSKTPANRIYAIRDALSADVGTFKAYLSSIADHTVPTWIMTLVNQRKQLYSDIYGSASPNIHSPGMQFTSSSNKIVPRRPRSGHSTPTSPLETIFEEEYPLYSQPRKMRSSFSLLSQPYYMTASLVYRLGYLMTTPLRVVARMVSRNY